MVRSIFIILVLTAIFSCTSKEKKNVTRDMLSDSTNTKKNTYKSVNKNYNIKFYIGTPDINHYPFRPGNRTLTKIYRLPPIKSVIYNNLDSLLSYECTIGEPIDSSVFKLTQYRCRLPDIDKYSVFYMFDKNTTIDMDSMTSFIKNNCNMNYDYFGYLILYDKKTTEAIVLNVSHSYYVDANEFRDFYIDKNKVIHIKDSSYTDGDKEGKSSIVNVIKRTVNILTKGEIKILTEK